MESTTEPQLHDLNFVAKVPGKDPKHLGFHLQASSPEEAHETLLMELLEVVGQVASFLGIPNPATKPVLNPAKAPAQKAAPTAKTPESKAPAKGKKAAKPVKTEVDGVDDTQE